MIHFTDDRSSSIHILNLVLLQNRASGPRWRSLGWMVRFKRKSSFAQVYNCENSGSVSFLSIKCLPAVSGLPHLGKYFIRRLSSCGKSRSFNYSKRTLLSKFNRVRPCHIESVIMSVKRSKRSLNCSISDVFRVNRPFQPSTSWVTGSCCSPTTELWLCKG